MKKIFIILTIAFATLAVSCQKYPVENTATVDLAGQWYLQYDAVDESGAVVFEDFNEGYSLGLTFNTSANTTDYIFVSDIDNLLGFQAKVPCNIANLTFGSDAEVDNVYADSWAIDAGYISDKVIVKNGKITRGTGKTPSGMPADEISFEVILSDDLLANAYGYHHYKAYGYRYTGFAADE